MRVVLTAEARLELRAATERYAKESPLLARRFTDEYKRTKALIVESPERWGEIDPGVRRVLLHVFPYALLYVIEGGRILVLAVKHHKRHPDVWRGRR